jgi:biotin operon repressor
MHKNKNTRISGRKIASAFGGSRARFSTCITSGYTIIRITDLQIRQT